MKSFDFFDFSLYRRQLMGVSILLIMLFHVRFIDFGFVGVEFFLLISAIGLYFSLKKNSKLSTFYKKRLFRILPTYLIVAVPFFLFVHRHGFRLTNYLYDLSGLCILDSRITFWFITQILLCYLVAPFYFRILGNRYSIIVPFIALLLGYLLGTYVPELEILSNRFAIFFMGLHLAGLVYEKKRIEGPWIAPVGVIAMILIIVVASSPIQLGLKCVSFFFLSIPALMLITMALKYCPPVIHTVLVSLGGLTLELYMLHENICFYMLSKFMGYTAGAVLSFPLCILLAYLLSKMTKPLFRQ